jgi:hypothetical protein
MLVAVRQVLEVLTFFKVARWQSSFLKKDTGKLEENSPSPPQMDQNSCGRSVEVLWALHSSHSTSVAKVAQAMLAQGGRVNVEVWGPSLNSLNDVVTFCHCHVILYLSLRLSDLSV